MWETSHGHATYTHYTSRGTSRIDRIYAPRNLSEQKMGVETKIAAFTDHLSVVLRWHSMLPPCGAEAAIGRLTRHYCVIKVAGVAASVLGG